jgi:AICAR transformylase/IMP cyclohydrolase PurH
MSQKHYALFSVNDTQRVEEFSEKLAGLGWTIIATSKSYEILKKKNFPVVSVEDFAGTSANNFGFPPTLHPVIENALTSDSAEKPIELVYDITYGLEIGNDVGGHALLALAAKGNRLPVFSCKDMAAVVDLLEKDGKVSCEKRKELAEKAYSKIAEHYIRLATETSGSKREFLQIENDRELLNGENPYQRPAHLLKTTEDDPLALPRFHWLTGNIPCFVNLADADCILDTLCRLCAAFKINREKVPYVTIAAKHGNACGIGIDWVDPAKSIEKALWGNPLAIWGGEVAVNFPLDGDAAKLLYESKQRESIYKSPKWMLDFIMAPEFDSKAKEVLGQRKKTQLFENPHLKNPVLSPRSWLYRFVRGGVLRQAPHSYSLNLSEVRCVGKKISEHDKDSLIIAWGCSFTSNHGGNEVALAKDGQLLGAGGGPSTVEAAEIAINRGAKYHKG